MIWSAKVPQKIKMFLWKVVHNILPVQENIYKKQITSSKEYPICKKESESAEHTFSDVNGLGPFGFE